MSLSANLQKITHRVFPNGDQQSAVVYLGQLAFSTTIDVSSFMTQAADLVTQVLPVGFSVIWELMDGGQNLLLKAGSRVQIDPQAPQLIPLDLISLEGITLSSPAPVVVENVLSDSRFEPTGWMAEKGLISGVSLRVGTLERPLGILEVFSAQRQTFSRKDVHFLQSVANLVGLVLLQDYCQNEQANGNQLKGQVKVHSLPPSGRLESDRYEIKNRLIESRERERLRLAQDLHDAPIQDLYGMIYQLDDLRDALKDPESEKILDECDHTLHKVVNSLRTICRELRPPSLSPFGLEVAIRDHIEKFHDQNPQITVHLDLMRDQQILSDSLRLTLFRIYQQAIHNVARHAQASDVYIHFYWNEDTVILEVKDNGQGFEVPNVWVDLVHKEHFGLLDIAERVESIKGKLEIKSSLGDGSLVRATIPRS